LKRHFVRLAFGILTPCVNTSFAENVNTFEEHFIDKRVEMALVAQDCAVMAAAGIEVYISLGLLDSENPAKQPTKHVVAPDNCMPGVTWLRYTVATAEGGPVLMGVNVKVPGSGVCTREIEVSIFPAKDPRGYKFAVGDFLKACGVSPNYKPE